MGKAQISGLLVSKQEVEMKVQATDHFDHCSTEEAVVRTMLRDYGESGEYDFEGHEDELVGPLRRHSPRR